MNPQQQNSPSQEAPHSTTGQIADQAREKSAEVLQQAQETAKQSVNQQKVRMADNIGAIASALRDTGKNLHAQDQGAFGRVAEQAADRLEQFSDDLQNKNVDEMFDDVQNLARRDPQLFLGGALVLGLLAARFLKSSGQRHRERQTGSARYYQSPHPRYGTQSYPGPERDLGNAGYAETYTHDDYRGFETGRSTRPDFPTTATGRSTRETGSVSERNFPPTKSGQTTGDAGSTFERDFPANKPGPSRPGSRPESGSDNPAFPSTTRRTEE